MGATETEFDYVIVGGGTAGCILAARLAEDGDVSVCLIEGGPAFEHDPMVLGYHGSVPLLGNALYDYDYTIVPQERGNSRIRQSRAKMLGGCSSHNDTVAFLPQEADLARWELRGGGGWSLAATRPYFDRAMERTHVHRAPGLSASARAVHAAALEFGLPEVDLHSDQFGDGAGWLHLNEREGVRQSTAVAYLYPLTGLPSNLTLRTETWVERVLVDDGRATGVRTSAGVVTARNEIILCAGAIDTPRLLMLSGIGSASELRELGIDPVIDLPGVGENLKDHVEAPVMWETERDTEPALQSAENAFFTRTNDTQPGFDTFFHVLTQPYYVPLEVDSRPVQNPRRGFCIVPNAANPRSVGRLRLNPEHVAGPPLIDPRYLTDADGEDLRILREGIRTARRLATETSLSKWILREVAPGPAVEDDEALERYISQSSNTVYHPAGTCRMGPADDDAAVVAPDLRVHGLSGLRVADASVFPEMIGVNPCLTVMMIGERCADLLRGQEPVSVRSRTAAGEMTGAPAGGAPS